MGRITKSNDGNQIDAQIDWACITSTISCIECDGLDTPGTIVREMALATTIALMTNSALRLAPPPHSAGKLEGAFDVIRTEMATRLVPTSVNSDVKQKAISKSKKWLVANSSNIACNFEAMLTNDDFKQWLDLEVRNIWKLHAMERDGLFDLDQKNLISNITNIGITDLEKLHAISCDPGKLSQEIDKRLTTLEFEYLARAYVGSFVVRSPYYDYIACMSGRKIMHHKLRTDNALFLPNTVLTPIKEKTTNANWLYYLAGVILTSAQLEKTQKGRITAYSRYTNMATQLRFQKRLLVPDGDEISTMALDGWLYASAKAIGIHTRSQKFYDTINAICNIGPGLLLKIFYPYIEIAGNVAFEAIGVKPRLAGGMEGIFDTKNRILDLVADIPRSRFKLEWDKFDEKQRQKLLT